MQSCGWQQMDLRLLAGGCPCSGNFEDGWAATGPKNGANFGILYGVGRLAACTE